MRAHEGVDDGVELPERRLVGEHDLRQLRPVKRAVGREDAGPERLDDPREALRPRLDDRPGRLVGVKDHRSERGEPLRHGALPRPDPAREPDPQHWRSCQPRRIPGHHTPIRSDRRAPRAAAPLSRGYLYVTVPGIRTLPSAQLSVTPAPVTSSRWHWMVAIAATDAPGMAE